MMLPCRCFAIVLLAALTLLALCGQADTLPRSAIHAAAAQAWVCVVNKVSEVPGQYCTYDAIRCSDGSSISLDHPNCNLKTGDCANAANDANCFDIPEKRTEETSMHPAEGGLEEKGMTKLQEDAFVPKLYSNAKILLNQLAHIETAAGKIKVRLFLIRAFDNNQKFFQIVGQGVEVKSDKEPDFVVAKDSKLALFKGKVCYLNLRGARYTVILNTKVDANGQEGQEPPLLEADFPLCEVSRLQLHDQVCSRQPLNKVLGPQPRFGTARTTEAESGMK